jgi:integrase/recombinase XerD
MSRLSGHAADYLELRRALGFKLAKEGRLLPDFAAFAEAAGADTVTVDLAVRWAARADGTSPVWAAQRLSMVRGFARYLQTVDPDAQVPPSGLPPARTRRVTPYIYSDAGIAALMAAARALRNPLKAATFATLTGLLAVTGMRGSEAMRLDGQDLDAAAGLVTIRATKFRKSRQLPLHPATVQALAGYQVLRDQLCRAPATASLLVSTTGARLCHETVQPVFRRLLRQAGAGQGGGRPRATVHGLRHYADAWVMCLAVKFPLVEVVEPVLRSA